MAQRNRRTDDEGMLVFATYAQTMLSAQFFEGALARLAHLQLPALPTSTPLEEVWARVRPLFRKTAGQLAKQLDLPEQVAEQVSAAVRTRNELAHRYLRARLRPMQTTAGRQETFRDLMKMWRELDEATRALDPEVERLARDRGVKLPPREPRQPWEPIRDLIAAGLDPPWPVDDSTQPKAT